MVAFSHLFRREDFRVRNWLNIKKILKTIKLGNLTHFAWLGSMNVVGCLFIAGMEFDSIRKTSKLLIEVAVRPFLFGDVLQQVEMDHWSESKDGSIRRNILIY